MATHNRGIRYLVTVLGFLALFATGYVASNVMAPRIADAQVPCTTPMPCMNPIFGSSWALGSVSLLVVVPAMAVAAASIALYYLVSLALLTIKMLFKIAIVIQHWYGWWDTFWFYNLNPALQDMVRQWTTVNAEQARAIGAFTDAADRNRAIRALRERELEAHTKYRPGENVCAAGTASSGLVAAGNFQRAYGEAATREKLARSSNSVPGSRSAAEDMGRRFGEYVDLYCDPNENGGMAPCTTPGVFAGMDVDVTGQILMKDTIDLTDPSIKKLVDDIVVNIVEPMVMDPHHPGLYSSSRGRQRFLEKESYKAKRQLVTDAIYHIVAARAPGSGVGPWLQEMRVDSGVNPADVSDNPSKNEIIQTLAADRYRSGKYSMQMIDEPENNTRERVVQEAVELMQMNDYLDLMDRYSLIVAARTGDSIRASHGGASKIGAGGF